MNKPAYITAAGRFLPGEPVGNDEVEDRLGKVCGNRSRVRRRILKSNQITTRHYALDNEQRLQHRNCEMAANAIREALERAHLPTAELELLTVATTMSDVLVPGFGSLVHAELGGAACEISTSAGVCASSLMAIKNAFLQVQAGEKHNAVACGSELPSRAFRASRFEHQTEVQENGKVRFDTEFLRWMLSDGAGAVVIEDRPATAGHCLKIEWVELLSHANTYGSCMFGGGVRDPESRELVKGWLEFDDEAAAARAGAFNLQQDIRMLDDVVKVGVDHFFDLCERRDLQPDDLDWVLCHYSSHIFKGKIHDLLNRSGVRIPEERWFTNLYSAGNTGAASIFVMIEEFLRTQELVAGQKILCMVPESGGFISSFMLLTVVDGQPGTAPAVASEHELRAPSFTDAPRNPTQERLVRELCRVWIDFERRLHQVPIVAKLDRGRFSEADYRDLLRTLRPQVIQGASWMARMISNFTPDMVAVRTWCVEHAVYGHTDYKMLDADYVASGGTLEEIEQALPNVGTEALSAWMYQRADRTNPLDLLGAMYVIEGLSSRLCGRWRRSLVERLAMTDEQLTFLGHHAKHEDHDVTGPIDELLPAERLTEELVDQIVRTARVTARLYLLQLEELEASA